MKEIITNLAAFLSFCIVFSGLTACGGPTQNTANAPANTVANTATAESNAGSKSKSSDYPPLAAGLSQAEFENLDGTKFKVADKKGKVLLLNIWGTWCGPCRAEMPHLVEMQNKYGTEKFEIIGLNIGDQDTGQPEGVELIKRFAEDMKLNYTLARSPSESTAQFYKITKQQVVPQSLLVDREGHLRGVFIGGGSRVINSMKETVEKTMAE